MSAWSNFLPEMVLGLVMLYLPGLLCVLCIGVRGFSRWLLAPAWSAGTLLFSSLILGSLGVRFSLVSVLAVQFVCVLVCLLIGQLSRRWLRTPPIPAPSDVGGAQRGSRRRWGLAFGLVVVLNALIMWWRSFGGYRPDLPPQQNDALFHNSGVWSILHSGDASPLSAFTRMYGPEPVDVVYPNVFHQFVALIADSSTVIPSTKVFLLGICVTWIVGVAGFSRAMLPTVRWAPWIAIVLAQFHPSFPAYLLNRVTIWPNALGISLLPGILAVIVVIARSLYAHPPRSFRDLIHPILVILPAVAGLAGTYPSVYFAMVVVLGGLTVGCAVDLERPRWLPQRPLRRSLLVGAPFVVALMGPLLISSGLRQRLLEWHVPEVNSPVFTMWSLLTQYPAGGGTIPFRIVLLAYAVLTVIGVVRALRDGILRPLAAAWLAMFLFTVGTAVPLLVITHVTSVWYYGIYRLVPYTLMLSIPLVVRELVLAADAASKRWHLPIDVATRRGQVGTAVLLVLATFGAAVVGDVVRQRDQIALFAPGTSAETYMLNEDELAMMRRVADKVDADALTLGTPSSGAAYLPSYANIDVVYRQNGFGTALDTDADGIYLAERFHDIHTNSKICELLEKYDIRYYYADVDRVYNRVYQSQRTPGLYGVDTRVGFELLDSGGGAKVFEITACDGDPKPRLAPITIDTVPDTGG